MNTRYFILSFSPLLIMQKVKEDTMAKLGLQVTSHVLNYALNNKNVWEVAPEKHSKSG